jgi:hypothetical protein
MNGKKAINERNEKQPHDNEFLNVKFSPNINDLKGMGRHAITW